MIFLFFTMEYSVITWKFKSYDQFQFKVSSDKV